MNKNFAVLGSPIDHSKSPSIHAAAYRVLREDWTYGRHEVEKGGLKRFIESSADAQGFSITMPLKEEAFYFASESDDLSKLTKSSNTLVRITSGWRAYNTDVFGITQAISQKYTSALNNSLVIGSGATAKSALLAISIMAPGSKVGIYARNSKARSQLISFGKHLGLYAKPVRFLLSSLQKVQLVVSTVPSGAMDEIAENLGRRSSFKPSGLLLDVAYSPWPSKLADVWLKSGQPISSGLEMLIWQAIAQIRIFQNGNIDTELPNEIAVIESMRIAASE